MAVKQYAIPFLDLSVPLSERRELLKATERVLTHGRIVLGPEVTRLEKKVASYIGRKYAVGVNSGTDALILALKAAGIGPGDEVITTSLSWIATANAIAMVGATPVFADIGEDLNIDPNSVTRMITKKTKAILPVHYTGRVCRMDELLGIARRAKALLIEDAAQAFGATYRGKPAGSFGNLACFSMNPMKVFGALGEAGMVLTDSEQHRNTLESLRYNGTVNKERCIAVSFNGRIDTLQAAMLLARFPVFQRMVTVRRRYAALYHRKFAGIPGIIRLPEDRPHEKSVYYTYTVRVKRRDGLKAYLERKGIETKVQHPYLMPDQPVYKGYPRDRLTRARAIVGEILCIPAHEKLSLDDIDTVAVSIRDFYAETDTRE